MTRTLRLATLTSCSLLAGSLSATPLEPGQAFPELRLPRLGSEGLHSLSSLTRGRKTLLLVYASW